MKKSVAAVSAASEFELLEPRVMLDATGVLAWTLSDDANLDQIDVISSMSALYESFEAEFDPDNATGVLKSLQAELSRALSGNADMFALADDQVDTRFGDLEDTFERVRLAAQAVVEEYKDDLSALITDNLNDVITAAGTTYNFVDALDTATTDTLVELEDPEVPAATATNNYLKFTDPETGQVTEYYRPTVVETKAEVLEVLAADGMTVETAAEPAEYGFSGYTEDGTFDLVGLLKEEIYLTAMRGSAGLFDDALTTNIRAYIAALDIEVGTEALDDITDPSSSQQTQSNSAVFTAAELDDLADYFTQYIRSGEVLGADLDVSGSDYVTVNGEAIKQVGFVDGAGDPLLDDSGNPILEIDGTDLLWNYLIDPDTLNQIITAEALYERADIAAGDEAVFRGNLLKRIDDFLDGMVVEVADVTGGVAGTATAFAVTANAKEYIRTVWAESVETVFNSLADADAELQAIQAYDTGTVAPNFTVTADIPEFDTMLNSLDLDGKLRASLPVGFDFDATATQMSFTIDAITTASATVGEVASVGLDIGDFKLIDKVTGMEIEALFEFGAANDGIAELDVLGATIASDTDNITSFLNSAELPIGFLSGNIAQISTGQVGLYTDFENASGEALSREIVFDVDAFALDQTANEATVTAEGDDFEMEMRAQEIGSNTEEVFDLANAPDLDLIRYDFDATLPTAFGVTGTTSAVPSIEIELTQLVNLSELQFTRLDAEGGDQKGLETFFEGTSVQFGLGNSGALGQAAGSIYEGLFLTSPLIISEFITSLGSGMEDLLTQSDFSVKVPMTDIDLADSFRGIADIFSDLKGLFDIDPADLGFVQTSTEAGSTGEGNAPSFLLGPEVTGQKGITLNSDDIAKLASIGSITFETYSYNTTTEAYVGTDQTIDLSGITPFDYYGEVADDDAFLGDLVAALNGDANADPKTGLAALGWEASVLGARITFTLASSSTPSTTGGLSLKEASLRDNSAAAITLKDFGIRTSQQDTVDTGGSSVNILSVQEGAAGVDLSALNTKTLFTMDNVRFSIAVDGVFQTVDVGKPTGGWGATDADKLDNLVLQFNDAMSDFNLDLRAAENTAGNGLRFELSNGMTEQNIQIALDPEALTRAFSMKGLVTWFQQAFNDVDCMPEFEIGVDIEKGDITLGFATPIEKTITDKMFIEGTTDVDPSTVYSLDIDDLELGDLQGVNLQADLDVSIKASVNMTAGFNIIDMQEQYKKSYAADPTDDADTNYGLTEAELENYEKNRGFASKIPDVVLDNTFITDLQLNAVLDASADNFEGEASMGMVGIEIEQGNSTFAKLNTELVIDLVGLADGAFSDRISGTQLLSLAAGKSVDHFVDDDGNTLVDGENVAITEAPKFTNTYDPLDGTKLVSTTSNVGTPLDDTDDLTYTAQRTDAADVDKITGYAVTDKDGASVGTVIELPGFTPVFGPAESGARFVDLLGRVELIGGILVDADGCALEVDDAGLLYDPSDARVDASGNVIAPAVASDLDLYTADDTFQKNMALTGSDQLVIHNGIERVDGAEYSMLQFNFDLPTLQIGEVDVGAGGLGATKIQMTVGDLFDIANTTKLCTDVEKLLCLALVDPNLLVNGVAGFGVLLEGFVDNLEQNVPILSQDIPLLNSSILDQFDFIGDFNKGMKEIQDQGGLSFENINGIFDDAFGNDVLSLKLNTELGACELQLVLDLNFLDDFKLTESFNLSLSSLLGEEGLNHLLKDAPSLQGVFSSLVDARGDAELVIDPALGMQFHLGLDLMVLKNTLMGGNLTDDVDTDTDVNALNTVPMLTTNGLGSIDLRIDWVDEDIVLGDFLPASTNPVVEADTVPEVTRGAFSLLFDFDKIIEDHGSSDPDILLTVGDLVTAMNAELTSYINSVVTDPALKARLDGTNGQVSIEFDAATKTFQLIDTLSDARAPQGATALFGGITEAQPASAYVDPVGPPATPYVPRSFDVNDVDFDAGYMFAVQIGDGPAVDVTIEASETARSKELFIRDLNRALQDASVGRDQISETALVATTVPLSQLMRFALDGTDMELQTTNFAQNNGYDEFAIALLGNDISHNVTFTVTEEGNSNAARLMGFGGGFLFEGEAEFEGNAVAKHLFLAGTVSEPIIYIDTDKTSISAELGVGVPGGLNVIVNLGPLEASIEDGTIFIGASGEGNERGYIRGVLDDIDDIDDGKYDLLNLYTLSQEDEPDYLSLFGLEMDFETRVDLPFSGAFGLLDPDEHGFEYISTLLRTQNTDAGAVDGDLTANASDMKAAIDAAQTTKGTDPLTALERVEALLPFFRGDAKEIYRAAVAATTGTGTDAEKAEAAARILAPLALSFTDKPAGSPYDDASGDLVNTGYFAANGNTIGSIPNLGALELPFGPHFIDLKLPSLPDCGDLLDLINNPLAVVNGLDMVLGTIQDFVNDAFSGLDLPMVGGNLMQGAQFFSDLRYDVIDGARDYLETKIDHDGDSDTPKELPTTLDLVNIYMNDALDALLGGAAGLKAEFAMDVFENDTDADHPALYGGLFLEYTVFEEALDVGFNLDIPGLNLEVDDASQLQFKSELKLDLGFGLDCNGFFVLNKFDDGDPNFTPEAVFNVTASVDDNFTAAMNIGGVLEVTASQLDDAIQSDDNPKTPTQVVAALSLDLFGEAGFDHTDGSGKVTRSYDFDEQRLLLPLGVAGTPAADFNRMVYLSQIDFNDFADVDFNVDINIDLDLTVAFAGVDAVPKLLADFIFDANYNPDVNTKDLTITTFEFHKISIDASSLEAVLQPIIDPIITLVGPIKSMISAMDVMPFSFFIDAFKSAFPIFNVIDQLDSVIDFVDGFGSDTDPIKICIGTYDFIGFSQVNTADSGEPVVMTKGVLLSQFKISNAIFKPCFDFNLDLSYGGSVQGPGINFKIPLLQDPMNALNMMLGRFDQVDLARVEVNLLTANANLDVAGSILGNVGLPGWAASAIRSGFNASVNADLKAAIEFGYDLSGVVNFANTLDPERLLDGIFIDPDLLYGKISGGMSVNAGIAGASGGISGELNLDIRDPNSDGKIRLPELLYILDSFGNQSGLEAKLGALFNGSVSLSAYLKFWAGINLPWPLPDLSWSTTLFDTTIFNYSLPAPPPAPILTTALGGTGFNMLNAGAQAGANMTALDFDGNDYITITNKNVSYSSNGVGYTGSGALGTTNNLVIAAGEGRNTINMSGSTVANTITYLGDENDTVTLANSGTHVVFAGDGNDNIKIGTGGTYYIFGEGGADNITVNNGATLSGSAKVYVFADDDFGMRDYFQKTLSGTTVSTQSITSAIETGSNFKVSRAGTSLASLTDNYTRVSQTTAGSDTETVTLKGGGSVNVFTGAGSDLITLEGAANGKVYAGAGTDQVTATNNTSVTVEAGAGDDLVVVSGTGTSTVYGWGAQGEDAAYDREARLLSDDDLIVGGSGADTIYGQYGKDILSGQTGNDAIYAGGDDDLASGGVLQVFTVDGNGDKDALLNLTSPGVLGQLDSTLIVETEIGPDDGNDQVDGGAGSDVLLGGSGQDTLGGGSSSDILVGDYGQISVSSNRIAQTFISTGMSDAGGTDVLQGGGGNDILVGGAGSGTTEVFTDLEGNNIVLGDFGKVEGNRILEAVKAYRSIASSMGSQDSITTGAGNDVIIGGEGNDTIDGGAGGDAIIGDLGSFVPSDGKISNKYYDASDVLQENTTLGGAATGEGNDVIRLGLDAGGNAIASDLFDIILGGGGGDSITGGTGGMVVMGDYGNIQLDSEGVRTLFNFIPRETPPADSDTSPDAAAYRERIKQIERIFQSVSSLDVNNNALGDSRSGDDRITTVGGTVYAVLGGGNDTVNLGDGLSYIVTDDGEMAIDRAEVDGVVPEFGTVTGYSVSTALAGADRVATAGSRDIIITGDGADTITAGDGRNFVLADNGSLETSDDVTALPTFLRNTDGAGDGDDVYTGGVDTEYVILGGGSDSADGGAGRNFILGDSGSMTFAALSPTAYTATLTSNTIVTGNHDGDDVFTGADGENFIIAGLGDADKTSEDRVTFTGNGNNTVMANAGSFTYTLAANGDESIVSTVQTLTAFDQDGNDEINTGSGRDIVALGMGNDTANLGDGDNFALGGAGRIELGFAATGSTTVRLTSEQVSAIAQDGNDSITAGSGQDVVALDLGADTANLGDGNNFALGGAGDITVTRDAAGNETIRLTAADVSTIARDGNDSITTGDGRDVVALGMGADLANLGEGTNFALGDAGEIELTLAASGEQDVRVQSAATSTIAQDGNDTVNTGDGNDFIVLGLGDDVGNFGNGNAFGVGSDGTVTYTQAAGTSAFAFEIASNTIVGNFHDGNDTINAVNDDDYIVLGLGDDVANVGDGRNRVIGDQGRMSGGPLADVEEIQSTYLDLGGDDRVSSGKDQDIFVLGQGGETANSGAGDDILIGDNAFIKRAGTDGLHSLTVYTTGGGGNDSLNGGADNDIIIGSLGDDVLNAGSGEDFILGDLGDLTFRNDADVASLSYTTLDAGGDDLIEASGSGDNILIGQAGADTISGGSDDDLIIGDLANITLTDVRMAQSGQSGVDRLGYLEFIGETLIHDDKLDGNDGSDMLIGGFGADSMTGGAGQDFLFGDGIMLTRSLSAQQIETLNIDTNFTYVTGGVDTLDGGTGNNIVVGGLGKDLFYGNTQTQVLAGDALSVTTRASFAAGFDAATPNREMVTVNFAGPYSTDLLTYNQLQKSIGAFFSAGATQAAINDNGYERFAAEQVTYASPIYAPEILAHVEAFFDDPATITKLAELLYFGADVNLISEEMLQMLMAFDGEVASLDTSHFALFKLLLQRVLDGLQAQEPAPAEEDAPADDVANPETAMLNQQEIAALQAVL